MNEAYMCNARYPVGNTCPINCPVCKQITSLNLKWIFSVGVLSRPLYGSRDGPIRTVVFFV